jgi:hypothetical protein
MVGGGVTGRAGTPDTEYPQMSPALSPILLALGDGATVLGGSGGGGGLGICPQPLISTAIPRMTADPRSRFLGLLAHRARSPPTSSSLAEERHLHSLLLRPAARDTDAPSPFFGLLAHRARSPPTSSSLAEERHLHSLLLRPAARDTDAPSPFFGLRARRYRVRRWFTVVLCHNAAPLPGSDKPAPEHGSPPA